MKSRLTVLFNTLDFLLQFALTQNYFNTQYKHLYSILFLSQELSNTSVSKNVIVSFVKKE